MDDLKIDFMNIINVKVKRNSTCKIYTIEVNDDYTLTIIDAIRGKTISTDCTTMKQAIKVMKDHFEEYFNKHMYRTTYIKED